MNKSVDSLENRLADIVPVVLSGGSGTRLWPMSRATRPKQFAPLIDDQSLFEKTVRRLAAVSSQSPVVVTNEDYRFLVAEELRVAGIAPKALFLEPTAKNTAAAIAVAAWEVSRQSSDALMLVCPSDHLIPDVELFRQSVEKAIPLALEGKLVTFGVTPTEPNTGYGYIKASSKKGNLVQEFVEKPDLETAQQYLDSGDYFWNAGIFLMRASTFLTELESFEPLIHSRSLAALEQSSFDGAFQRLDPTQFAGCPSESVDVAVMEQSQLVALVPLSCRWSDLGTWAGVWESSDKDAQDNVTRGETRCYESQSNIVFADSSRLVCLLGCNDMIVVDSGDTLLVAPKSYSQDIKKVVNSLDEEGRKETKVHRQVFRPWGNYEGIDSGQRYQVKRIVVKPGEQLSLQMHHHRAEHWTVVTGTALVTNGEKKILLSENESTFIPLGAEHRLENPGVIPLELIEVQSGSYLGEDDIVRLEDRYGRNQGDLGDPTDQPLKKES